MYHESECRCGDWTRWPRKSTTRSLFVPCECAIPWSKLSMISFSSAAYAIAKRNVSIFDIRFSYGNVGKWARRSCNIVWRGNTKVCNWIKPSSAKITLHCRLSLWGRKRFQQNRMYHVTYIKQYFNCRALYYTFLSENGCLVIESLVMIVKICYDRFHIFAFQVSWWSFVKLQENMTLKEDLKHLRIFAYMFAGILYIFRIMLSKCRLLMDILM